MTRETKIGMLVGLVFIIIIGIIMTDTMTSALKPPQPAIAGVAPNVDRSLTSPGAGHTQDRIVSLDGSVQPGGRLVERDRAVNPLPPQGQQAQRGPQAYPDGIRRDQLGPIVPGLRDGTADRTIVPPPGQDIQIIPNPDNPNRGQMAQDPGEPGDDTLPRGLMRYEVRSGDTVSRMAGRFLGSNSNANRERIIKLNPSLQDDPNKLMVGDVLIVPDPSVRAEARADTRADSGSHLTPLVASDNPGDRIDATPVIYTTQPGDTLWKIAGEQCGSASRHMIEQIKAMNKDVLKGKELLHPNVKLRLPARTVASTN